MITIKSKALKVGDSFKLKRTSYTATKIIDLDPLSDSKCPHRANKVLVMCGCRQFVFVKSSDLLLNVSSTNEQVFNNYDDHDELPF